MATVPIKEKLQEENAKRLKDEIEKKHGKTVEQLYDERDKRVRDAIELRQPDRVPVTLITGLFAARYAGLKASAMYYDHVAYREACKKTILDFEPDTGTAMGLVNSGLVFELLAPKHQRWPGGTLPDDVAYQFVEGEYMKAEEYDLLLSDPSDFIFRCYLPRIYGVLEPLAKLPPIRNMVGGLGFTALLGMFTRPEFIDLAKRLNKAGLEQEKLAKMSAGLASELEGLGFPSQFGLGGRGGGIMSAPFDTISDHLRGMRGTMIDMYRCPDKLLEACDKILDWRIAQAAPTKPDARGNRSRAGMPLHRGSDGFMSLKDFERFYWPTLKKAMLHNIEIGYIAAPFCEGIWDDRLEYLRELPKGKAVCMFEKTDMFKAKEVLGDHICIQGNVPPSLLEFGTPQEVDAYCKELIEICGKGGGFILSAGSATDQARPENIKAMVDSTKKYNP